VITTTKELVWNRYRYMDNYLGFGNNQSVDTEYKKNKNKRNSTHLALNSRYCNNKCRKCKKNMDPYVTGLIIRA